MEVLFVDPAAKRQKCLVLADRCRFSEFRIPNSNQSQPSGNAVSTAMAEATNSFAALA